MPFRQNEKDPSLKPRLQEEIKTEGGPYNLASTIQFSILVYIICVIENGNNNKTIGNRDVVTVCVKTIKYFIYFRSVKI